MGRPRGIAPRSGPGKGWPIAGAWYRVTQATWLQTARWDRENGELHTVAKRTSSWAHLKTFMGFLEEMSKILGYCQYSNTGSKNQKKNMLRSLHLASPDWHLGNSSNIRSQVVLETVSSHLDQESEEIKYYYFPPSYPVLFCFFIAINHPLSSSFYHLFLWVLSFLSEWVKLLSSVWLFATPWIIAYQAPPSMGFSRQEYWSGLPFLSPEDLPDPGIEPRSPKL